MNIHALAILLSLMIVMVFPGTGCADSDAGISTDDEDASVMMDVISDLYHDDYTAHSYNGDLSVWFKNEAPKGARRRLDSFADEYGVSVAIYENVGYNAWEERRASQQLMLTLRHIPGVRDAGVLASPGMFLVEIEGTDGESAELLLAKATERGRETLSRFGAGDAGIIVRLSPIPGTEASVPLDIEDVPQPEANWTFFTAIMGTPGVIDGAGGVSRRLNGFSAEVRVAEGEPVNAVLEEAIRRGREALAEMGITGFPVEIRLSSATGPIFRTEPAEEDSSDVPSLAPTSVELG